MSLEVRGEPKVDINLELSGREVVFKAVGVHEISWEECESRKGGVKAQALGDSNI